MSLLRTSQIPLIVLGLLFPGGSVQGEAPPADQKALASKAVTMYRANESAIKNVECDYSYFMNKTERKCRYARSDDKYYHASVDLYPTGARGLTQEATWDGQVARCRSNPHYFRRSVDPRDAKPTCPLPQSLIGIYLTPVIDAIDKSSTKYSLVRARLVEFNGLECIELEFS